MKIEITNEEAETLGVLVDAGVASLRAQALLLPSGPSLISKLAKAAQDEIARKRKLAQKT